MGDKSGDLYMIPTNKEIAILVFAREVQDEIREKRLFGSDDRKNIKLFSALNRTLKQTVIESGIPYFWIATKDQVGDEFVDRYQNAIRSVFEKGYERVVVVGNDSPELSSHYLREIAEHLKVHDLVYGRTANGGIYTLGLTKVGFEQLDFHVVPWQTTSVASHFDAISLAAIRSFSLCKVFDELNTQSDVWQFIRRLTNNRHDRQLYGELFDLVFDTRIPIPRSKIKFNSFFESRLVLRGPPCLS